MKGNGVGITRMSTQHANFIVNTGQATASDVLALIACIQQVTQGIYQVGLVPKIE
ncbi:MULTISPECIES: hypothetical protein [Paenibacillus]|uniref:hypothetical protein n=1 Tax=Paenibacillus TaxID=44249 RepID=UPI0009DA7961|nr:hypothetical protein [Paenibacillus alvei]